MAIRINSIFIFYFFLILFSNFSITEVTSNSQIKLIIEGIGHQNFLNEGFYKEPTRVYVNGILYNSSDKNCELINDRNDITIIFDEEINTCENMFKGLDNIKEIDLSNFDTSKVTNMNSMFYDCINLTRINFGHINTSSVEDMSNLFRNCIKLKSLDLSNFDTSKVKHMGIMFSHCEAINSIDVSNFDTSQVETMNDLFAYCYKLVTVNLSSFNTSKVSNMQGMFYCCSKLKFLDMQSFTASSLTNMAFIFRDCFSLVYVNLKNFKINENDNVNVDTIFSGYPPSIKYCIEDNYTKYMIIGSLNSNCSDICFQENIKFDMDQENCVEFCDEEKCEFNNICYDECPEDLANILNSDKKMLSDLTDINTISDLTDINTISDLTDINTIYTKNDNEFLLSIQEMIINDLAQKDVNNYTDTIFTNGKVTYTITTTSNQKNNNNDNVTVISFGDCEFELKGKNNIPINDSLYILKIDAIVEQLKIPKIEYELYYPFSRNNITKLDLSVCKDIKINISIPINISLDELNKYNSSSDLYNDLCYTLTTESGTDKSLKDRQKEFVDNSMSVCEEDCDFIDYDNTTKKAICSCYTKIELPLISDIKVDKNKLLDNFKNINNIANFKMLNCLNLFFNKNNFFKNTSNYLMIILFIISIISIYSFIFRTNFDKHIFIEDKQNKENIDNKPINIIKQKKKKKGKKKKSKISSTKQKNHIKINYEEMKLKESKESQTTNKLRNTNININIVNNNDISRYQSKKSDSNINKKIKFRKKKLDNKDETIENFKKESSKDIIKKESEETYNDMEMNSLDYKEALIKDKRNFWQYYLSLIRTNHIFIFTFFQHKDYNSQIIKIYIFLFIYDINHTVSAMFYSDSTMHNVFINDGSFDFSYQLPQMFYSLIISIVLKSLLNLLGLYEKNILIIRKMKNIITEKKVIQKQLKIIKIKIIIFFIITYILLFSFWIYLGCFCAVYKNTQVHLFFSVISSFALSFITPFLTCLIPGVFRIVSLKNQNIDRSLLYKFSKILQNL